MAPLHLNISYYLWSLGQSVFARFQLVYLTLLRIVEAAGSGGQDPVRFGCMVRWNTDKLVVRLFPAMASAVYTFTVETCGHGLSGVEV